MKYGTLGLDCGSGNSQVEIERCFDILGNDDVVEKGDRESSL